MKTEPTTYSIDDLARQGVTPWEGVRNYQARNFMRDSMHVGDAVFLYHSNTSIPGIVGLGEVASEAYPDYFAWDPDSKYWDPRSTPENPVWYMVDIQFHRKLPSVVSLHTLKKDARLNGMMVVQKGSRLSVQPVTPDDFEYIMERYIV